MSDILKKAQALAAAASKAADAAILTVEKEASKSATLSGHDIATSESKHVTALRTQCAEAAMPTPSHVNIAAQDNSVTTASAPRDSASDQEGIILPVDVDDTHAPHNESVGLDNTVSTSDLAVSNISGAGDPPPADDGSTPTLPREPHEDSGCSDTLPIMSPRQPMASPALSTSIDGVLSPTHPDAPLVPVPDGQGDQEQSGEPCLLDTMLHDHLDKRSKMVDRRKGPVQVVCHICCAEFGTSSLTIHQKTCLKKQ